MSRHGYIRHFVKTLLLGVCLTCALSTFTQAESDSALTNVEPDPSNEFITLNELEVRLRESERYDQFKALLKMSSFTPKHQDLIAQALSKSAMGVPVSTYRQKSLTEGTDMDPTEITRTYTVVDRGIVEDDESRSRSLEWTTTPFSNIAYVPLDAESGQILEENDEEITIRFDVDIEIPDEEEMPEFFTAIIKDLKLVVDFKLDKQNRSLQTASFHLLEPIRKLFLFTFKKFKITPNYEFNEECSCMVVNTMNVEMNGSALIFGRFYMREEVAYSDIQCEKPIRYLIHDRGTDDVFRLLF